MYQISCECGSKINVELHEAGTDQACPHCAKTNRVPPASQLKQSISGTSKLLNGFDSTLQALHKQGFPFDGQCHCCRESKATHTVPIHFKFLVERHLHDESGIELTPMWLKLKESEATEKWTILNFPLNFCEHCYDQFQDDWRAAKKKRRIPQIVKWCLLSPLALLALLFAALIPVLNVPIVVFLFYALHRYLYRKKGDPFLLSWLANIEPISTMLAEEDEFGLSSGPTQPLTPGQ